VVDTLQSRGVSVNDCFILGLDNHTPDIFPVLRDCVLKSRLAEVQFTVQTPFPSTPLAARLKREGRLLAKTYWDRYTLFDITYRPKLMSVAELEEGLRWLFAETYSKQATRERQRGFARARRAGEHP
jgi:hypothetical protein